MSLYSATEDARCRVSMNIVSRQPGVPVGERYLITVVDKPTSTTVVAVDADCLLSARHTYQALVHRWAPRAVA